MRAPSPRRSGGCARPVAEQRRQRLSQRRNRFCAETVGLVEPSGRAVGGPGRWQCGWRAGGVEAGQRAGRRAGGLLAFVWHSYHSGCSCRRLVRADKEYILIVMQNPNTDERIG